MLGLSLGLEVTISHPSPQGFTHRPVHSHHIDLAFIPGDPIFTLSPVLPLGQQSEWFTESLQIQL